MKFSVLMIVHKSDSHKHLKQCLDSLIDQTLLPTEVVIVSDGGLPSLMRDLINAYRELNIHFFKYSGNQKLPGALNFGLQKCQHSIVARMDPDDICRENRFEKQINYFKKNKITVLGSNISEFNKEPKDIGQQRNVPRAVLNSGAYMRNPINHMTAVFDKAFILKLGAYEFVEGFEDWHLWLKVIKQKGIIENMEDVLVDVRVGNGFLKRRGGFQYAVKEIKAYQRFYSESLMPIQNVVIGLFFRAPLRILPFFVLKLFYSFTRKQ